MYPVAIPVNAKPSGAAALGDQHQVNVVVAGFRCVIGAKAVVVDRYAAKGVRYKLARLQSCLYVLGFHAGSECSPFLISTRYIAAGEHGDIALLGCQRFLCNCQILFELAGVSDTLAREAMRLAAAKVGIRTVMVSRNAKA